MSNILKNWWKFLGIALIMYVFTMIFMVPMGPGLLSSESQVSESGVASIKVSAFATHFDQNPENIKAYLRLEDSGITIECNNIIAQTNNKLSLKANLPDTVPSSSWDLLINAEKDGTLYLPNALFHEPKTKAEPNDLSFTTGDLSNEQVFEKDLGLHFPYQPRIVESIRNLPLHVPMWFTMFFLMGIGFAQSIRTLRNSNNELSDTKALSSIKVGIFFGVLGLLTGSLWARFT